MPSLDQLVAFAAAADEGSFSAAARKLQKAQSAVSTAVINLEIDLGLELFDRAGRHPRLTEAGKTLLKFARHVMQSHQDLLGQARALGEGVETRLCIAVEQGIFVHSLRDVFHELSERFPLLELEIIDAGINEAPGLLKRDVADLGMMLEQEVHPRGFHFRGVGHSRMIPVCGKDHPLAALTTVSYSDLRQHRQIFTQSNAEGSPRHKDTVQSPILWFSESPYIVVDLLVSGLGWAVLPQTVVSDHLARGDLVRLVYDFQQSDILQGVDVVWTEKRPLGEAGRWLLAELLSLDPDLWL